MKSRSLAILALLTVGGCRQEAPGYVPKPTEAPQAVKVSKETEPTLLPFRVGNQWTYQMTIHETADDGEELKSGESTLVYRITSAHTENGVTTAELVFTDGTNVVDRQIWTSDAKGIYQISVGGDQPIKFNPPQPSVLFPISEHQSFKWSGTGLCVDGTPGHADIESKVGDTQTVDTDQGKMNSLPIISTITFKSQRTGKSTSTTWFQPGFGITRYYSETTLNPGPKGERGSKQVTTLRLRNSALKQQ